MTTQVVTLREPAVDVEVSASDQVDVSVDERVAAVSVIDEQIVVDVTAQSAQVVVESSAVGVAVTERVVMVSETVYLSQIEEEAMYAKRVDVVGGNVIYKAWAAEGTDDATESWRIQRVTFTGSDGDRSIEWADGASAFAHAWTDRLTLDYS